MPAGSFPWIPATHMRVGPPPRGPSRPNSRSEISVPRPKVAAPDSTTGSVTTQPLLKKLIRERHEVRLPDDAHELAVIHDGETGHLMATPQIDGVEGRSLRSHGGGVPIHGEGGGHTLFSLFVIQTPSSCFANLRVIPEVARLTPSLPSYSAYRYRGQALGASVLTLQAQERTCHPTEPDVPVSTRS